MRHTLLLLLAAASMLLASCGNGGNADEKQHVIDSLVKLVPAGAGSHERMDVGVPPPNTVYTVSAFYIPNFLASQSIQQFHNLIAKGNSIAASNLNRTSFILPAITLKRLLIDSACDFVVFYEGFSGDSLGLIYTGARYVPGYGDSIYEITMKDDQFPGVQMLFDNGYPCPQCAVGLHSRFGGLPSVIYSQAKQTYSDGNINGSILPSGTVNVKYGGTQVFTITPNNNYLIDTLWINGQYSPNPVSTYTFTSVKSMQTIWVNFKKVPKK